MATPTLRALRNAFPENRIVGVMRPVIRDVLEQAWGNDRPWIDESLLFNKKASPNVGSRWGLVRQIRGSGANVGLLLTNSLWSAAVLRAAGVGRVVGYRRDGRGFLLSDAVEVPRDGKRLQPVSAVDYYLQLANWLGCDSHNRTMQICVTETDERLADRLWSQIGFSSATPTIAINSGSANAVAKLWPVAHVQELARRLASELEVQVLLHCGPADRATNNRIAEKVADPRVASMGIAEQLPIGLSKAVLKRCAAVVSTDSGPRHLAVAFDRPVVSLFGSIAPQWSSTYNRPEIVVAEQHPRGMGDISVDRVFAAVQNCMVA
ncbi:MAG: glycosyltransferase family 9 protein [Aureliella sp.]